jgi:hypothetical protein
MSFVRNPAPRCPYCDSEILMLFLTGVYIAFDATESCERKQIASVTAFQCGEDHFFFLRSSDIQIPQLIAA